ncbi:hypothetical protein BsIDN1_25530 [Bacillus safensis]|uniref:Molybdopterin molybdenumtransferase n=1 Tax=Bacillus safensis TaxID=561879 RepID=A0A5S9M7W0_BACIA|nr:hypothetical protein BsIDN1_25530 [Bacillus safensis]
MMERRQPIQVEEAIKKVHQYEKHGEIEWVPLKDSLGRFIAEDILADHDVPAFDRSPYDGFALRAEDTKKKHQASIQLNSKSLIILVQEWSQQKPSVPFRPFVL